MTEMILRQREVIRRQAEDLGSPFYEVKKTDSNRS